MIFRLITLENQSNTVIMRVYGEDGIRYNVRVDDFYPYFYVLYDDFWNKKDSLSKMKDVMDFEFGFKSILGKDLVKIVCKYPNAVKEVRKKFKETWEANVTFVRRFMVDVGFKDFFEVDLKNCNIVDNTLFVSHRDIKPCDAVDDWAYDEVVLAYDIETYGNVNINNPDKPIISISAKIFNESTIYSFLYAPKMEDVVDAVEEYWIDDNDGKEYKCVKRYFGEEGDMLEYFADFVRRTSPDVLAGYNIVGFDTPILLKRMDKCGLDREIMSPLGLFCRDNKISGLINCDIQLVWTFNQASGTRYQKLVDVAKNVADYKIPKSKRDELVDRFDVGDYDFIADYNHYDVLAIEKINNVDYTVDSLRNYMRQLGISEYDLNREGNKHLLNILHVSGEDDGKIPTSSEDEGGRFEGGAVYEPVSGKHKMVGVLDLSKIYPTVVYDGNFSYETLVRDGSDDGICMPNGVRFRQDKRGIFPRVLEHMFEMRKFYEEKMKNSNTHVEYLMWYNKRQTVKISTNSLYGVLTSSGFPLYSRDIARTITYIARECLKIAVDVVESCGFKVLYGDTDSVFVYFNTDELDEAVKYGLWLQGLINKELYKYSCDLGFEYHNFFIEFETLFDRILLKDKKKRYAGRVIWRDGEVLEGDDAYIMIRGFDSVRSNAAMATQDMLNNLFDKLLKDKSDDEVVDLVCTYHKMVSSGSMDLEYICPYPSVKKLDYKEGDYHVFDSLLMSNQLFGLEMEIGRHYYVYLREGAVELVNKKDSSDSLSGELLERKEVNKIAFRESDDIPDSILKSVDYDIMAEKVILDKVRLVLNPIGMGDVMQKIENKVKGFRATSLKDFVNGGGF